MYGVLLAGGTGSRLWPLTEDTNKHLVRVYDRQMVYFPLGNLVRAGINDVVIVTGGEHYEQISKLLDSVNRREKSTRHLVGLCEGESLNLRYRMQDKPDGIADALALAEWIVRDDSVAVVLADNIFEDDNFLSEPVRNFNGGAHIFLKEIKEDELYEKGKDGKLRAKYGMAKIEGDLVKKIIEKPTPEELPSCYAVTGAYLYDSKVFSIPRKLTPSARNELEITDVNNKYIEWGEMKYTIIKGWWGDAGESIKGLSRVDRLVEEKFRQVTGVKVQA